MDKAAESPPELWTFDRFITGHVFGSVELALDEERRSNWDSVFGDIAPTGEYVPQGLYVALMMEAYIRAIQPRPPGNIHAQQKLCFSGTRAAWGDIIRFDVSMGPKEIKRERRWASFIVTAKIKNAPIMTGEIRSIWAA